MTIKEGTKLVFFQVFTPIESSELIPIDANMLALNIVKAPWNSDINSDKQSETILENGIIFNYESKFFLAEKFIPIEFLVTFRKISAQYPR